LFSASQIVAHLVGDYIVQSHWMAVNKVKASVPAFVHALDNTLHLLCNGAALRWL